MTQLDGRRTLVFSDLDDIVKDARMLLAKGYVSRGHWNLSQACSHIHEWLRFPVDGYPSVPLFLRPLFWALRSTIMPGKLRQLLADKSFPAGKPTMPQTVFPPNASSDEEAVRKLEATVERVRGHGGDWHPSPLFGKLDRQTHIQLQLVHAAHHLSFLVPKST
jgi:hypothetical protein